MIKSPSEVELVVVGNSRNSPDSEENGGELNPLLSTEQNREQRVHAVNSSSSYNIFLKNFEYLLELSKHCSPAIEISPSLMIIGLISFVGDCCRGVLFPVMWYLCQYCGGNLVDLGYLISVFSFGRLCATLPLGYFCDKYRHKKSLLISNAVVLLGAVVWTNVSISRNLYLLYFAQFLLGVGSGSLGVTRSYVVEQCPQEHRTEMLAYLTALQYAGFTVSPIIGAALTSWGQRLSPYWSFGLPPYFLTLLAVMCILLLVRVFKDIDADNTSSTSSNNSASADKAKSKESTTTASTLLMDQSAINQARQWFIVAVLFISLNITVRGSIAVYETMGAEIWQNDYRLNTVQLGTLVTLSGGVGTFQLLFFKYFWTSRFDDLRVIQIGMLVMIFAQVVMHSYGTPLPSVQQFIVSIILMYGFGYPLAQTATLGAFSKLQKAGPQAALMSYFATAGSLARIIIPILTGYMDKLEDNSPFILVIFMVSLSYAALLLLKQTIYDCLNNTSTSGTTNSGMDEEAGGLVGVQPVTLRSLINSLSRNDAVTVGMMLVLAVISLLLFAQALMS